MIFFAIIKAFAVSRCITGTASAFFFGVIVIEMDAREAREKLIRAAELFAPLTDDLVEAIETLREAA